MTPAQSLLHGFAVLTVAGWVVSCGSSATTHPADAATDSPSDARHPKATDGGAIDASGDAPHDAEVAADAGACTPFGDPPRPILSPGTTPSCNADGADTSIPKGKLLGPWQDPDGTPRYACLYVPPGLSSPVPLLLYVHPSLADADSIKGTNLLSFASTTSLYADGHDPGFAVLAPEGRDIPHYYPVPDQQGLGWDMWYRQFGAKNVSAGGVSYAPNVDMLTLDHFVSEAEAGGGIDSARTFVTGWSNGASFAYAYGLYRPRVRAIAVYSAGTSPFGGGTDPCPQNPVLAAPKNDGQLQLFRTDLPIYQVHNACDIGNSCPTVRAFDAELVALGFTVEDVIVDGTTQVSACAATCGVVTGTEHHVVWPSSFTAAMLSFLAAAP